MLRNRRFSLYLFFLLLILSTACGGKVILSDDAVRIRNIHDFVNELKGLYEQHDVNVLDLFSREYLAEANTMKGAIIQDMERFNTISLNLFIDRVEINGKSVTLSVHWNGTWKDTMRTYREGGSMVLQTSHEDTIRITGITGDSPFGISRILDEQKSNHE